MTPMELKCWIFLYSVEEGIVHEGHFPLSLRLYIAQVAGVFCAGSDAMQLNVDQFKSTVRRHLGGKSLA